MKSWIHFLGGSVSVYLLMAACSAGTKHAGSNGETPIAEAGAASIGGARAAGGGAVANAGTSAPNASGSQTTTTGGIGGMIGEVLDPVPDAEAEMSGTRLRARYYVGADGSRQFIGWHDKERGEDCAFVQQPDGTLRCVPFYSTAAATYFADAACVTQPLVPVLKAVGCTPSPPAAKYSYVSDVCGKNRQRFTVSQQQYSGPVYQASTGKCTDVSMYLGDTFAFFALSAPVAAPDSDFVAATEKVD
jgi:hypothetical protein